MKTTCKVVSILFGLVAYAAFMRAASQITPYGVMVQEPYVGWFEIGFINALLAFCIGIAGWAPR